VTPFPKASHEVAIPEHQARSDILRFSHLCYERHLLVAMDGNLSIRLKNGEILCTRAGCHKGFVVDDDLVVIDEKGRKKRGSGTPTSEIQMHLACYEARPDIQAVIHAHPPLSVAFTIAGVSMARCVLPEVVLTLGVIPTVPYATTGTRDLAQRVGAFIKDYDALLMDTHGAVTAGHSLLEAFCRLETMEHTALVMKTAHDLGAIRDLPGEEAAQLRRLGLLRYGGPPEAVARAGEPASEIPEVCLGCTGCACPRADGVGPRQEMRIARVVASPMLPSLGERRGEGQTTGAPAAGPSTPASGDALADALVNEVLRALRR
jgi:L-fuculose-phosphate aldolase